MNLYKKSMLIIGIITLVGVGGYFGWEKLNAPKEEIKEPTAEELLEQSVDTEMITTNFADEGFIKMRFKIITKSKKDAEEIGKLQFHIESSIIQYVNNIKKEEANGPKGLTLIENNLQKVLNQELGTNYITRVYMIDKVVQ
ncbi:hypothetical protein COJ96_02220 [Bacillus sp. AFS073361]|uniref:flagellar basal body-associated FliL family protein n=1 Tax=Bacillus sp. AFS073361 TaxID=2033511 RepID=UPI000BF92A03|nr:flagellar basal body-associated FliL family protein [Bacillus sp. AFS073361]PFP30800.1 hypothetical protein COJ96_02220 [Bacillus sp. AFS073361]